MFPVSVWILMIDLKHSIVGRGGRCPKCKKSLSCNHWGKWEKWITFHDCNLCQIAIANSSACSAAFIIMPKKWYLKRTMILIYLIGMPICYIGIHLVYSVYSLSVCIWIFTWVLYLRTLDPGINVAPPLKKFRISILILFYINLGIVVIFFFVFKIFQKLISVALCLFRSQEYLVYLLMKLRVEC